LGRKWGPSSTDALAATGATSRFSGATAPHIPSVTTKVIPSVTTKVTPPHPYSAAKVANFSPLGRKWGPSSTDALAPTGATSRFSGPTTAAPRNLSVTAKVAPPTPYSTAKVANFSPLGRKWGPSSTDALAPTGATSRFSGPTTATPRNLSVTAKVAPPTSYSTAKVANFSPLGRKWGPSSTDALAPTGASSAAVASPVPGSTAKVANESLFGIKLVRSSRDTL
jgi:hypothetical protein